VNQVRSEMSDANALGVARPARATIAPTISHLLLFFSALLSAEILFELAHIVYLQVITFHPLPHLDEWRTLILFSRMEQNSDAWSLLFVPHAEHRPVLPRLIFLLDTKLAHGTGALSLVAIDCLVLGSAAVWSFLLIRPASRNEGRPAAPYVLVLCIAVLLFSGHQMSNFIRGFQVTMFMVYFFALLSFAAFAMILREPATGPPVRSALLVYLSCFFAVGAAFSMGNGLLVLPILLVIACVRRREIPAGTILIIGIVIAATIAAYLNAPGSVLGVIDRTDYKLTPSKAAHVVSFFLAFLGGPWASIAPDSVTVAGLVTLLLSVCAIVKYWRRDRLPSYELVSAGLIALVLGSAAAAALARLRFGIEAATESRYSTSVLVLYVALLVSFWPKAPAQAASAARNRASAVQSAASAVFVFAAFAYAAASHWKLPYDYSEFTNVKAEAEVAYVANVQDPLPFSRVVPQPPLELAWQARGYALRHNRSVFSTMAAQSVGRPVNDAFSVSDGECIGHLDQVERIVAGPNGGYRVAGWAWDNHNRSVPAAALLVENGIVKGIGRFIRARADVVAAIPEVRRVKNGFVGYVPRGVEKVTAYVLDQNQTTACRIPGDLALPSG
jgi:hypothetical protein